jgi:hypothetical protein
MGLYDGDGVSGDRVVGEATAFDRSPSDRSPGRPRPRFLVSWANIADELGALLTLKSEITCTTWTEIKLCFLYPPGDPRRPACCDGYPPKDPVEPPGQ